MEPLKIRCKNCSQLCEATKSIYVCDECFPLCYSDKPINAKPRSASDEINAKDGE